MINGARIAIEKDGSYSPSILKTIFSKVYTFLGLIIKFLSRIFGSFGWSAPPWAQKSGIAVKASYNKNPSVFLGKGAGVIALLCVILGSWNWWQTRPQPEYCSITVSAPTAPNTVLKKSTNLSLSFGCSAANLSQVGQVIEGGIKLNPSLLGEWKWTSDRVLVFEPKGTYIEQDWKAGEEYSVELSNKLISDSIELESHEVSFKPSSFVANISRFHFEVDAKNPSLRRVSGSVNFNWPVNPESFRKNVTLNYKKVESALSQSEVNIPVVLSFNETFTEAFVSSENIEVPELESTVKLHLDKGYELLSGANAPSDANKEAKVPGRKGSFKIASSRIIYVRNERFEPEQVFMMDTSLEIPSEDIGSKTKLWLLPQRNSKGKIIKSNNSPEVNGDIIDFPFPGTTKKWNSFAEVDSNVLSQSTPIEFKVLPSETPRSKMHSLKLKKNLPFNRSIYVEVEGNLKAFGDYELGDKYHSLTIIPSSPKELKIQGQGGILSFSGEKTLSIAARGVKNVEIEISKVLPSQLNRLIKSIDYSDISTLQLYEGTSDTFSEVFKKEIVLGNTDPTKTEYFSVDLKEYLKKGSANKGLFYIRLKEKNRNTFDKRLILVSDIGFMAKKSAQGSYDVFAQNLNTGLPVNAATVEVVGANGLAAYKTVTDSNGKASIPPLKDLKREKQAIAIVIRQGNSLSFLPLSYSGERILKTSRFDTGGVYESSKSDALSAMLFTDRGIYRPGETVKIGIIVRSKKLKSASTSIPLQWVVSDSRGTEINRKTIKVSTGSLAEIEIPTTPTSSTGNWHVRLTSADPKKSYQSIGQISFRVEEFQPDKMKISSTFSQNVTNGWINPENLKANVSLKNLFGTPAQNRRVSAGMSLSPTTPYFKKYSDYIFSPLHEKDERFIETPFSDKVTDDEGKADYVLDLSSIGSGLYSLSFRAEGYENENGGRSVSTRNQILVSNLPFLVGIKTDGDLGYINVDSQRILHLQAIDSSLNPIAAKGLTISIIEKKYVSALIKDSNGAYKYQSVLRELELSKENLDLTEKGTKWNIPSSKPGDFVAVLKTKDGLEVNKVDFTIVGNDIQLGRLDRNAELQLKLSKSDYKPGESIELEIRAPYSGRGLITIERDQVYTHKWFKSSGTKTLERIKIPKGLEGNAYVSVSFLRGIDSKEIYMSPLSYAIAPFSLARDSFKTAITLDTPERVRPGESMEISYSTSRNSDLVLWGIDEGILQVAKYKTPSPLDFFLKKKALQVTSLQILDLLMPEYSIIKKLLSPGGDDYADEMMAAGKNLNPFRRAGQKPVVFWSGILKATNKTQKYNFKVPEYYNGSIKIFALTSSRTGMGVQTVDTTIKGDLILSPSAPLVSAPGDLFDVSVGVSNQAEGSGKDAAVSVKLTADSGFEIVSESNTELRIPEGDEKSHIFKLKAKNNLGSKTLTFQASTQVGNAKKVANYSVDISVRPITPYIHKEQFHVNESLPQTFDLPELETALNKSQVLVSSNPLDLGEALKNYLVGFPYGCTEQILSRAISQMILKSRFGDDSKNLRAQNLTGEKSFLEALSNLRTRQQDDGGFSLYPGGSSNLLASVWTLQFLQQSSRRGFKVPGVMLSQALNYAANLKFNLTMTPMQARWTSFGVYLLASSGNVPRTNLVEFEEKYLNERKDLNTDLAAVFLAGTYKLLKQDKRAENLIQNISFNSTVRPEPYSAYNEMSRNAALLLISSRHFPNKLNSLMNTESLTKLLDPLKKGEVQTMSAGLMLLALDEVGRSITSNPNSEFKNERSEQILRDMTKEVLDFQRIDKGAYIASVTPNAKQLVISGKNTGPLFSYIQTSGFEVPATIQKEIKNGIEVSREYLDSKGNVFKGDIPQGASVMVVLRIRSLTANVISNVAVVDLIPSGFEIQLDKNTSSTVEYADRREDRVVLYLDAKAQSTEYRYEMKAISRGEFSVPPAFAEAMYDRKTKYRGIIGKIKVVGAE